MTKLLTIVTLFLGLTLTATTASAFDMVHGGWHCWFKVSAETCYWPHNGEPYYNVDGTRNMSAVGQETIGGPDSTDITVAMLKPRSEIKYWACFKGARGYTMASKDSYCPHTARPIYGRIGSLTTGDGTTTVAMMTPEMLENWRASLRKYSGNTVDLDSDGWDAPVQTAMWGNHGGNIFDGNAWRSFWDWSVDNADENTDTQIARNRRGSTCSANPYGRRSTYCANPEVEAPVEQTTAFGQCLLDDQPVELETLTDCRSDACLGRKFYYGSFGRVGR